MFDFTKKPWWMEWVDAVAGGMIGGAMAAEEAQRMPHVCTIHKPVKAPNDVWKCQYCGVPL